MNPPRSWAGWRLGLAAASILAGGLAQPVRGDEPGPVPLLRDAAPAEQDSAPPAPATRTPLGDWRLVGALGVTFAVLIGARLAATRRAPPPPPDVFEVLGTASLGGQQAVRIVRFGPKTLLVGVSSAGATTLAEISDPQATACIAAACRVEKHPPRPVMRPGARRVAGALIATLCLAATGPARAEVEDAPQQAAAAPTAASAAAGIGRLVDRLPVESLLPSALGIGVMSLVPAVLLMTTCFVRISVVLALVRQGLGAPQIPSNQIVAALALFLSALVMWPVWTQAWRDGVEPYRRGDLPAAEAFDRGVQPVRRWMATQIEAAGNRDTMLLFLERHPAGNRQAATYDDVPLEALLPAFLVSELETAFAVGFRMLLPFLVIDVLVAVLAVSSGLVMLPPTLVSLPLKLLVFVAADGWTLVVRGLLDGLRIAAP